MTFLQKRNWPPVVVGFLIAVVYVVCWFLYGKMPGASGPFVRIAYFIESYFAPLYVEHSVYFKQFNTLLNWHVFFVIGVCIGGGLSAVSSSTWSARCVPTLWEARYGSSKIIRFTGAFFGGAIMLIGARLAGGCTSGKGLAEGMVFLSSAYVFMGALFLSGIIFAHLFYKRG